MPEIDMTAYGEPGRVMGALTVMQIHLKVMMEEVRLSVSQIRDRCQHLDQTMMKLAKQSADKHERICQTLAIHQALWARIDAQALSVEIREVANKESSASIVQEQVASQLNQVAGIAAQSREELQGAWICVQDLEGAAAELEGLVKYFEV